jgi:hypothetical protein
MREHVHTASRRRDQRLAQIRKITLWIGGSAAAASLGLGAAFAHAVPGHAASSTASSTTQPGATPSASADSGSASAGSASAGSASPSASKQTQLAQPRQQPTQTSAPHTVTSGGS